MDTLQRAKELGIENAESLTPKQLEKAIAAAEKAAAKLEKLQGRATELGMDHEGVSAADLEAAIAEEEASIAKLQQEAADLERDIADKIELHKKFSLLLGYLGFDGDSFHELNPEELEKFLADRDLAIASQLNIADATMVELEGKTDKTFTFAANKKEYQFTKSAPAAFRFAGVVKTQAEWIEDKDAMEIMVSGNLSYLKPVKN